MNNKIICNWTALSPQNGPAEVTIQVLVDKETDGTLTNLTTVFASEPDPDINNNTVQQEVSVNDAYLTFLPILLK